MLKKSKNKPNNNIPSSDDEKEIEEEQDVKPKRYLL